MRNYFPKCTLGARLHTLSKWYDVPVGFVTPPSFEAVYYYICGCWGVAIARYRMIGWFVLFLRSGSQHWRSDGDYLWDEQRREEGFLPHRSQGPAAPSILCVQESDQDVRSEKLRRQILTRGNAETQGVSRTRANAFENRVMFIWHD